MKNFLKVVATLSVIAVTYRMAASLLQIEKMMKHWYKVDFDGPKINFRA